MRRSDILLTDQATTGVAEVIAVFNWGEELRQKLLVQSHAGVHREVSRAGASLASGASGLRELANGFCAHGHLTGSGSPSREVTSWPPNGRSLYAPVAEIDANVILLMNLLP